MNEFLDYFETVWQTMNDRYFDPTFGGLDWNEVHDRYRPQVTAVEDERRFYELLNKMLFELNVSHTAVIPPEAKNAIDPTLCAEGSIGVDLRLLGEQAVITTVESGSPGEQAGLRPGFVVQEMNGQTIQQMTSEIWPMPPFHDRNKRRQITNKICEQVYGPPDTLVRMVYLDEGGEAQETVIRRIPRAGKVVLGENLPPFFVEFDSRRLDGDIGYIRFNAFLPPVHERFAEALASLADIQGLIVDIRGNHGGVWPIRKLLAEQLVRDPVLFCNYQSRESTEKVYLEPVENAYAGSLAILVDVLSVSSAEEFAGALQATQRGVVVGERTPGVCVVGDFLQLPNGALVMFPVKRTITANGTVLEGHGVIPDIEAPLDRTQLLQGIDSQVKAAIRHLKTE